MAKEIRTHRVLELRSNATHLPPIHAIHGRSKLSIRIYIRHTILISCNGTNQIQIPPQELLVGSKEGAYLINWDEPSRAYTSKQLGSDENGGVGEIRLGSGAAKARFIAAVSPMHGNQLVVFTPPQKNSTELWKRTILDESLVDGHALACGDLLGLGRDQIVVGWRAMNKPANVKVGIKLFIPDDSTPTHWRSTWVDDNTMACEDLLLADLNGDGTLDIIAAGGGRPKI